MPYVPPSCRMLTLPAAGAGRLPVRRTRAVRHIQAGGWLVGPGGSFAKSFLLRRHVAGTNDVIAGSSLRLARGTNDGRERYPFASADQARDRADAGRIDCNGR